MPVKILSYAGCNVHNQVEWPFGCPSCDFLKYRCLVFVRGTYNPVRFKASGDDLATVMQHDPLPPGFREVPMESLLGCMVTLSLKFVELKPWPPPRRLGTLLGSRIMMWSSFIGSLILQENWVGSCCVHLQEACAAKVTRSLSSNLCVQMKGI